MSSPEPDPKTIDAWLNGELSPEEAMAVDAYFDANPNLLRSSEELEALLPSLANGETTEPDAELDALVERFKTSPGMEQRWDPAETDWESLLEPPPDPPVGDGVLGTLGPYQVESLIATGGMGIIFKARDPKLDRTVALKVLAPQLASMSKARERFLREARAAAKLEHENILPIYAVHDGDVPYFSMRYVDGGTLEEKLHEVRKLELDKLKSLTLQIASALETAHKAGIIHRDIKPANILFDSVGDKVWVCDFGIARSIEDPSLTYADSITGTPQYMSPEQAKGGALDGRSDLFSLGAVLFRCATGRSAFSGDTTPAVLKSVADDEAPKASQINPELPAWYARLLENLLAKEPADRLPDATTVVRCIGDEHAPRPKSTRREVRRQRLAIAGACLIGLLVIGFLLLQLPPIRNVANRTLIGLTGHRMTIDGRLGTSADLATAIAKASDGDVIFLHGDSPTGANSIQIPKGKRLTLRAAEGSSPLVELTPGVSGIIARSPLVVEGIRFRDKKPVYHSGGAVTFVGTRGNVMRHCQFKFHSETISTTAARRPRALSVADGAQVSIESCFFDQIESCAVLQTDKRSAPETEGEKFFPNSITFRSSILTGSRALTTGSNSSGSAIKLHFSGCLIATDALFYDFWNTNLPTLAVDLENCIIAPTEALLWIPRERPITIKNQIRWAGRDNTYQRGITYIHGHGILIPNDNSHYYRVPTLHEWAATGIPKESGTMERIFTLTPAMIRKKFDPTNADLPIHEMPFVQEALTNQIE